MFWEKQVGDRDAEGMCCLLRLALLEIFQHKGRLAALFELMKCNLKTALAKYGAGPPTQNAASSTCLLSCVKFGAFWSCLPMKPQLQT